jgi:electron transfer flavoprotein beta subunit
VIDEKTPADLGIDITPRLTVLQTVAPEGRKPGVLLGSVTELVEKLSEAGVL